MAVYLYIFASIIIVSLISLMGVIFFVLNPEKIKKIIMPLVSLSAGTMLGGAFLHLLPEIIEEKGSSPTVWLWLLAGIVSFFILEKIIHWHHCHISNPGEACDHAHTVGKMNIVGDALHNFIDGAIIAGSFLVSLPLGLATTIAVIAHEVPQEIGDFGVLLHAGYSRAKALALNLFSALVAIAGAAVALILSTAIENFIAYIIPFAAGGFIYIATADLIPELKKDTDLPASLKQLIGIMIGISLMILLKQFG